MTYAAARVKDMFRTPAELLGKPIEVKGWVRGNRDQKDVAFLQFNDGTFYTNMQVVAKSDLSNFDDVKRLSLGSSITVRGRLQKSEGKGQDHDIVAEEIIIEGFADLSNPIQNKRMTMEFLREIPHMRMRTNTFMAVFRVRSLLAHAIHTFFQERDFVYVHTPIITSADAEGAGEMFRVTTLEPKEYKYDKDGNVIWSDELLGRKGYLTVSGQLNVEPFCVPFRNVYTFGPTFRAENSNTARHANEFWMIEPEIAFADLEADANLAEDMLKFIFRYVLDRAPEEMEFFNQWIDQGILPRIQNILENEFARMSYTEAIEVLKKSGRTFEYAPEWGISLQTEHERYLAEEYCKKPVFVMDYPKDFKAFYMRLNDDNKTVRAMDVLVPGIGEIIGGSQREERPDVLLKMMEFHHLNPDDYQWYTDLRRFGTFPHAGFGLGFERAVMYLTGMKNIRDVIPYPRTPNNILF
ncbi:MAG: asparagine--tRNA ligase [Bacteroidia bacterium]